MRLEEIKNKIGSRDFLRSVGTFFFARLKLFVFVLFLLLAGYCFYLWYIFVCHPQWTDAQKNAYEKAHDNEVTFDIEKFKAVVAKKREREVEYQKSIDNIPGIFHLK